HRRILVEHVLGWVGEAIVLLEEQPVFVLGVDERPTAAQFAAAQKHGQSTPLDALPYHRLGPRAVEDRTAVVFGGVDACIPDDDLTAAVFTLGDDALERAVVEWVILGHDRQAPLPVGIGRPIRDRPR